MRTYPAALLAAALLLLPGAARPTDHSELVKGPFKTGPDVTKACLQCHEQQAKDFMKTVHWTWSVAPEDARARARRIWARTTRSTTICIALPSNEPRCTSCHAGYGWKDASFDFSKAENVDCLVCHDTTGTYKKLPAGAGHPAYEDTEFPPKSGKIWKAVDLEKIARSVGPHQPRHLRRLPLLRRRRRPHQARRPRQFDGQADARAWTCTWRSTAPT